MTVTQVHNFPSLAKALLGIEESAILVGDAMTILRAIPRDTFQCCVTSPPYWGLRDYGTENQIGAEEELDEYVRKLVRVFRQVRRVLKEDGSLWLNLGDSYTSGNRKWRDSDNKNPARAMSYRPPTPKGLKPKDLIGVPWRLAFALQADGWFLRADVVWHKPNCQPESVQDRPTRAHEYVFLLTKSQDYYYDREAVMEPTAVAGKRRNLRTVWSINTEAFPEAHFATFPPALVEPCIRASSRKQDFVLDPFLGSGTVALVGLQLNRRVLGIELKEQYAQMASKRIGRDLPLWYHASR